MAIRERVLVVVLGTLSVSAVELVAARLIGTHVSELAILAAFLLSLVVAVLP